MSHWLKKRLVQLEAEDSAQIDREPGRARTWSPFTTHLSNASWLVGEAISELALAAEIVGSGGYRDTDVKGVQAALQPLQERLKALYEDD